MDGVERLHDARVAEVIPAAARWCRLVEVARRAPIAVQRRRSMTTTKTMMTMMTIVPSPIYMSAPSVVQIFRPTTSVPAASCVPSSTRMHGYKRCGDCQAASGTLPLEAAGARNCLAGLGSFFPGTVGVASGPGRVRPAGSEVRQMGLWAPALLRTLVAPDDYR
jgi:hypothetical protein